MKYQATFRDRKTGRTVAIPVEDLNSTEARKQAAFFEASHGRLLDVKPIKA